MEVKADQGTKPQKATDGADLGSNGLCSVFLAVVIIFMLGHFRFSLAWIFAPFCLLFLRRTWNRTVESLEKDPTIANKRADIVTFEETDEEVDIAAVVKRAVAVGNFVQNNVVGVINIFMETIMVPVFKSVLKRFNIKGLDLDEAVKRIIPAEGDQDADVVSKMMQNILLVALQWFCLYMAGFCGLSFGWLVAPLMLTVLRKQWKTTRDSRLNAAKLAALTSERAVIETSIKPEHLPPWVYFPDKERAEWINTVLLKLWPDVEEFAKKLVAEILVNPETKQLLKSNGIDSLTAKRISLGKIPPRLTGIKVYEKNVDRKQIILDADLVFASDCDIKICVMGLSSSIKDFSLRGAVRIVIKPFVTASSLIGGFQLFFLTNPEIDFDLGGIANLADLPVISNAIRNIILEHVANLMVLPNKLTKCFVHGAEHKEASELINGPSTAGVLRVHVKRAINLRNADASCLRSDMSDPYAILTVGARSLKTPTIKNNCNPSWNFFGDFPVEVVEGQNLTIQVFDEDTGTKDDFLGRASVSIEQVASKGTWANWVNLEDEHHPDQRGKVCLSLSWLELTPNAGDIVESGPDNLAKCLLLVYIDSCQDLLMEQGNMPSPKVEMKIGNGKIQMTEAKKFTINPIFEKAFVFLVDNPQTDELSLTVTDSSLNHSKLRIDGGSMRRINGCLGRLSFQLSNLIKQPKMEYSPPRLFSF